MSELASYRRIRIIMCSVLPICGDWLRLAPTERILELNEWIKDFSNRNGYAYVDYFSVMADGNNQLKREYTSDCLHLIPEGYRAIEPLIEKAIESTLKGEVKSQMLIDPDL